MSKSISPKNFLLMVDLLNNNKCLFINTDTVCGLLSKNIELLYEIKNRPINKKIVLFIINLNSIPNLSEIQKSFCEKFWPGNLTIIKNGISYRFPNKKLIIELIKKTENVYCSSANFSGEKTFTSWKKASKIFNNENLYFVKELNFHFFKKNESTIINIDTWNIVRENKSSINIIKAINLIKKDIYG